MMDGKKEGQMDLKGSLVGKTGHGFYEIFRVPH